MKKSIILIGLLMITQSAQAYFEPQWSEFCPVQYINAEYRNKIERNPVIKPLAFVGQVCTLNIVPVYWTLQKRDAEVVENNYWVQRKQQFNNEIETCKQYNSNDNQLSCYMNIRQVEANKNAQYENVLIAKEQMKIQRLRYMQQSQINTNLHNLNNNLNGIRYGY